jgi:hypothetical protein
VELMQFRPIFAGIAGAWALTAAGVPAFAQTAGETATKWGLPGEWKLDCKSPASQRNQAIEFIVRDGRLLQERSAGSVKDVTTLTSAVARADGSLETVEISASPPPTTRQIVRRRHGDGRFAVWSNRVAGSEQYSIRDGRFANGGGTAPTLNRCRAPAGRS